VSQVIADQQMLDWFTANRHKVEFYMLHRMYHDVTYRNHVMTLDLHHKDFESSDLSLLFAAIKMNEHINNVMGYSTEAVLSFESITNSIRAAAVDLEVDDIGISETMQTLLELAKPEYTSEWYILQHYSGIWLMSRRFKAVARNVMMTPAVNASQLMEHLQKASEMSNALAEGGETDGMTDVLFGEDEVGVMRRSTLIPPLDKCLNGGWGDGECYLAFGGTGAGKSILAGQAAWNEISSGGHVLITSTELTAHEYVARIMSNACDINIGILQDCKTIKHMKSSATRQTPAHLLGQVMSRFDTAVALIKERLHVAKCNADANVPAVTVLQSEYDKFKKKFGKAPTLTILDWLGTLADVSGSSNSSSERAAAWERSANSCVTFASKNGVATLVLAQAVNDAHMKAVLTLQDIGIAKGIGKNMVVVIGITNFVKRKEIIAAGMGKGDLPADNYEKTQMYCACKTRKGPPTNVMVERDFAYQRFIIKR
jgi:hypothetical protein